MAKTNKIVYVTQAQYSALITNGSVDVGGVTYTYDANNTYMVREDGGGGGSGDVTASGTLSVGAVMIGLGNKTITSSNGTNGKFLGWNNGATWQGLYLHTIYAHQTVASTTAVEIRICFLVISTKSTTYDDLSAIPAGRYLAVGYVDGTSFNEGACRALYFERNSNGNNGKVHYLIQDNSNEQTVNLYNPSTTITDTVTQIL